MEKVIYIYMIRWRWWLRNYTFFLVATQFSSPLSFLLLLFIYFIFFSRNKIILLRFWKLIQKPECTLFVCAIVSILEKKKFWVRKLFWIRDDDDDNDYKWIFIYYKQQQQHTRTIKKWMEYNFQEYRERSFCLSYFFMGCKLMTHEEVGF